MAITREKKEQQVGELKDKLERAVMSIICDYQGLSVAEMQELRASLKDQGGAFKVMKKTLMQRALKIHGKIEDLGELDMEGQIGLVFGLEDEASIAQVIAKFAKDHPALEIKNGLSADGQILSAEQIKHLATLPSKEQLRGQLVGTINAPVSGFVNVLAANLRGLVNVFKQLAEQKA